MVKNTGMFRAGPDPTLSVPDFSVPCRAGKRTDPILDPSGPSGHIPGHFFDFGVKYVLTVWQHIFGLFIRTRFSHLAILINI